MLQKMLKQDQRVGRHVGVKQRGGAQDCPYTYMQRRESSAR
jgi:hypothetical protein